MSRLPDLSKKCPILSLATSLSSFMNKLRFPQMYDCIVVGAGPAGLFYADEYLRGAVGNTIGVLDAGTSLTKRACPLVDHGSCSQCKVCLAVYGSGGAGMYSDGKLSSFPAGSGLERHFGAADTVVGLNNHVLRTIERRVGDFGRKRSYGAQANTSELAEKTKEIGSNLKGYDVVHLGTEGIQEFCATFETELESRGVEFLWRTRLEAISRTACGYELFCTHPRSGALTIQARTVVLATGKASGTSIRKHFAAAGVVYLDNNIEMGVRVEVARAAIDPISSCHLDAKLKFMGSNNSEIRTFCVCNGGYLVSCYYDDFNLNDRICTISGFSFRDRQSDNSNFGLLVRKKFPSSVDAINLQLNFINNINRVSGHGGTVVQRYGDFLKGIATTQQALDSNGLRSTLSSSTPVDLGWLLPGFVMESIRTGMEKLGQISPAITSEDTLLHAPVWELVHDRPVINRDFESTAPGLFIIGDATGIARGIVQAASSGVWAGRRAARQVTAAKGQAGHRPGWVEVA
ncbi:MAG: NAD(P)/FAD-dependent oxidoreductase [Sphingomonadaceae bacterium]